MFLLDLLTGHEPALAPERELSQLAALRQATRLGRFSARANIRAAVWDKPRSDCTVGVSRFMGRIVFHSTENSEEPNKTGNSAATEWQHLWLAGLVRFAGTLPHVVFRCGTDPPAKTSQLRADRHGKPPRVRFRAGVEELISFKTLWLAHFLTALRSQSRIIATGRNCGSSRHQNRTRMQICVYVGPIPSRRADSDKFRSG